MVDTCAICLDSILEGTLTNLPCNHSYHIRCVRQLHKAICPLCQNPFGEIHGIGKEELDIIKEREEKNDEERKQEEEEASVQLVQELQNEQNGNDMLNALDDLLNAMMAGNRPMQQAEIVPLSEDERTDLYNELVLFFEINYDELGAESAFETAHQLVHQRCDNPQRRTDCNEINELVETIISMFMREDEEEISSLERDDESDSSDE